MRKLAILMVLVTITAVAGAKVSPGRSAPRAITLLDVLPDGTAVAVIDFQKIAGSSLWTMINAQDKLKKEIDKAQSEMADLGVKLTDVHSVALVLGFDLITPPWPSREGLTRMMYFRDCGPTAK
jgi:hypothetical protein